MRRRSRSRRRAAAAPRSAPAAAAAARSRQRRRGRLTAAGLHRGSPAARCSRRNSLRVGVGSAALPAGLAQVEPVPKIRAGRRATTRLAARQVRRRHLITVIRATGAPQNRSTMDRRECAGCGLFFAAAARPVDHTDPRPRRPAGSAHGGSHINSRRPRSVAGTSAAARGRPSGDGIILDSPGLRRSLRSAMSASGLAVRAGREQPHLSCAPHGRGTILSLELRVDIADVGVDGVHRDR